MKKIYLVIAMRNNSAGSIKVFAKKCDAESYADFANKLKIGFTYIIEEHEIQ